MKKVLSLLLVGLMMLGLLAACGSSASSTPPAASTAPAASAASEPEEVGDIVDGRFVETRQLSVEIYDRGNDGGSKPEDNVWTDYIKAGMLEKHNVEVTYQVVPRFPEDEVINTLLAANDAPGVCVTYSYPTILTYANMGGVHNLAPLIEENRQYLDDLFSLLGEEFIYYDQDPNTGDLWAIEGRRFNYAGERSFIREDWLAALDMAVPTTLDEFTETLRAFRDNADTLLGADAAQMVPFMTSSDVGWGIIDMADSIVDGNMTQKDYYVYGFDDRRLMYPNYKEAVRILNSWYNEGLVWKDFPLYEAADPAGANLQKAGYVGAYQQSMDDPYRNGADGVQYNMQLQVGPEAAYIPLATFKNDQGVYRKNWGVPVDRKVFMPATNEEPVAGLMYINFISSMETLTYLQAGEEGVNHEKLADGSYSVLAATGEYIQNSLFNIDMTMTVNGLHLGADGFDEALTVGSLATGYGDIDPKYISMAYDNSPYDIVWRKNAQAGEIKAEEGMATSLKEKRDNMLNECAVCPVDEFDAKWDAAFADYLASGGQAIIDERLAAWEALYGDATDIG